MLLKAKSFADASAALDAVACRPVADTNPLTPVFHAQRFAVDGVKARVAPIPYLRGASDPRAVSLAVSEVVVNALNSHAWRWDVSHIPVECLKRIFPPGAHGYPSFSVVLKSGIGWVKAAFLDILPAVVYGGFRHAVLGSRLFAQAAARACSAALKVVATNRCGVSTNTDTDPFGFNGGVAADDGQSRIGLSGYIEVLSHDYSIAGAVCSH